MDRRRSDKASSAHAGNMTGLGGGAVSSRKGQDWGAAASVALVIACLFSRRSVPWAGPGLVHLQSQVHQACTKPGNDGGPVTE